MGAVKKQQYVSSRADSDWRVAKAQRDFAGHIFVCSSSTIPDLDRMIFGLPARYEETVRCIRKGMPLFLFNYTQRLLYGVFEAASDGGFNIDPIAWENTDLPRGRYGHPVSRYPAQVRVRIREEGPPLDEATFRPILDHVDGPKFKLDLTAQQVQQLLHLFGTSPLEREFHVGKNGCNRQIPAIGLRDPESPRSAYKSDSDYYSDCSSRGMNSGEDDWTDETLVNKVHYHQDDEGGMLSERLSHTALNESETYDSGHFDIPATLEDQLTACCYSGEDMAWKESFQGAPHCATQDYESPMVLRLHENDPAVNSNSSNCIENGLDHQIVVNGQENTLAMPLLSSQMQFPFPGNENMIFIPVQTVHCQQRDTTDFPGHSQAGKWNDQKRCSRVSSHKQSFNQHRAKDGRYSKHKMPSESQNGHVQPQKLQVLVPFCTQGPGQVGDQGHATVLSPMFMPANGPLAFAQLQTGARVDDSGQSFEVSNDTQLLPERLQQLLQSGQGPILLMPSIMPRPPPVRPAGSITAGLVEALHFEILQFSRWTRPSSEIQLHVEAAIDCVRRGVKMVWPDADVEVFGSFATGLCLQHSDVDLAVVDAPRLPCSENLSIAQVSASLIRELAAGLKTYEWCESINPLDTASMPVLKCLCRPFHPSSSTTPAIAVDITIGGTRNTAACADQALRPGKFITRHTGGAAREYVLQKIRELPALAPLVSIFCHRCFFSRLLAELNLLIRCSDNQVLLLKSFLHHKGLSNVYSGGLGSFSLTLLVAFFLERVASKEGGMDARTSDLPTSPSSSPLSCSSEFSDDSDAPSSSSSFGAATSSECGSQSLGEFYVRRAAGTIERVLCLWDQTGCPQLGALLLGFLQTFGCVRDLSREKIVLKGIDGSPGGFSGRDDRHVALWIDDPLRPGVNIGAGSFGMVHVQTAFKQMLQVLISCPTVLMSLQCEDKDCQDLAAMSHFPYLRRLVVEAGEFQ